MTRSRTKRRWRGFVGAASLILGLVCTVTLACSGALPAVAADSASVSGVVKIYDDFTQKAGTGLTVSLRTSADSADLYSTSAGSGGAWSLGGVPAGSYLVAIEDKRATGNSGVKLQFRGATPAHPRGTAIRANGGTVALGTQLVVPAAALKGSFTSVCGTAQPTLTLTAQDSFADPFVPVQPLEVPQQGGGAFQFTNLLPSSYGADHDGYYDLRLSQGGTDRACRASTGSQFISPKLTRDLGSLRMIRSTAGLDFDGDGRKDLIAIGPGGAMVDFPGSPSQTPESLWGAPSTIGSGWNAMNLVRSAEGFAAAGEPDILARDANGDLWLYRGDGRGGFQPGRTLVGTGWQSMTTILSPADFDGDGVVDVIARARSGELFLYPRDGNGGWKPRTSIGTGWQGFLSVLPGDDINGDGFTDLLARYPDGSLYAYYGDGHGGFLLAAGELIGGGWNAFDTVADLGDMDGDGRADLLGQGASGFLYAYAMNGDSGWRDDGGFLVGQGWGGYRLLQ